MDSGESNMFKKPLPVSDRSGKLKRKLLDDEVKTIQLPSMPFRAYDYAPQYGDEGPPPEDIPPMSSSIMAAEALRTGRHRLPLQIMPLGPKRTYRTPPLNNDPEMMIVTYNGVTFGEEAEMNGLKPSESDHTPPPKDIRPMALSVTATEALQTSRHRLPLQTIPPRPKPMYLPEPVNDERRLMTETNNGLTIKNASDFEVCVLATVSQVTTSKEVVSHQNVLEPRSLLAVPRINQPELNLNKSYIIRPPVNQLQRPLPLISVPPRRTLVPARVYSDTNQSAKMRNTFRHDNVHIIRPPVNQLQRTLPPILTPPRRTFVQARVYNDPNPSVKMRNTFRHDNVVPIRPGGNPVVQSTSANILRPRIPAIPRRLLANTSQLLPIRAAFMPTIQLSTDPPPLVPFTSRTVIKRVPKESNAEIPTTII